jgi:putative flippase GtrA
MISNLASQIVKFGLVGIINTGIDFAILNLLINVTGIYSGIWLFIFNVISFGVAVINSYFMNKYWAFKVSGSVQAKEIFKFVFVSLIGLFLNSVIVYYLGTFFILSYRLSASAAYVYIPAGLWDNLAKLAATAVSLVWNFIGYKLFVFNNSLTFNKK